MKLSTAKRRINKTLDEVFQSLWEDFKDGYKRGYIDGYTDCSKGEKPRCAEQTEPQTIRCPKCGRTDYIREFGKDFSVTAEEAGFKYKCINCNTYIEPQTEREGE